MGEQSNTTAVPSGGIVKAMLAVMAEVGVIEKGRKAPGLSYAFRGIDDILPVLQPLFVKHGVLVTPEVIEREREMVTTSKGAAMISVRVLVRHTFSAIDGSTRIATTLGEALDTMDKATNKAMTAAFKLALVESFSIPTQEAERDTEATEPVQLAHSAKAKSAAVAAPPMPADEIEKEKATLRALFETSATVAELDATWVRVKKLPNPDVAELTPVFKARKNTLAQQAAK